MKNISDSSENGNQNSTFMHSNTIEITDENLTLNNNLADENRRVFSNLNVSVFNLMSSSRSGKTSILEKTIKDLSGKHSIYVIEGDQQTGNDAQRIARAGAKAIQINTGNGYHLDAEVISRAFNSLKVSQNALVFIENIGNVVCPPAFDLGEKQSIVVISVNEAKDKLFKCPNMFVKAEGCTESLILL